MTNMFKRKYFFLSLMFLCFWLNPVFAKKGVHWDKRICYGNQGTINILIEAYCFQEYNDDTMRDKSFYLLKYEDIIDYLSKCNFKSTHDYELQLKLKNLRIPTKYCELYFEKKDDQYRLTCPYHGCSLDYKRAADGIRNDYKDIKVSDSFLKMFNQQEMKRNPLKFFLPYIKSLMVLMIISLIIIYFYQLFKKKESNNLLLTLILLSLFLFLPYLL